MRVYRTSKVNKHSHIAYVPDITGEKQQIPLDQVDITAFPKKEPVMTTSIDQGHSHTVSAVINLEIDPNNPLVGAVSIVDYVCDEANDGSHTHVFEAEILPKKEKKQRDEEILANVLTLRRDSIEEFQSSLEEMRECEKFYSGVQWDGVSERNLAGRAVLTFNHTAAALEILQGYQRGNRSKPKFYPVEGGDEKVANILDLLVSNVCHRNNWDMEESRVFEDQIIVGMGVIKIDHQIGLDLKPKISLRYLPWRDFKPGPHQREDLEDMKYCHIEKWVAKTDIETLFPEKKKEIRDMYDTIREGVDVPSYNEEDFGYGSPLTLSLPNPDDPEQQLIDALNKNIKLVETWVKEPYLRPRAVLDTGNGDVDVCNLEGYSDAVLNKTKTIESIDYIPIRDFRMRKITWAGTVILEDEYPDVDGFPVEVVYAKKRGNRISGKVQPIMDANIFYNKISSQLIDAIMKTNNYNTFYDQDTFPDHEKLQDYVNNASIPGTHFEVSDVNQKIPIKFEENKFPFELANAREILLQEMHKISNINADMMGADQGGSESNVLAQTKIRQAVMGNEYLFDNLNAFKNRVFKKVVKLAQKLYSAEDIIRVTGYEMFRQEIQQLQQYQQQGQIPQGEEQNPMMFVKQLQSIHQLLEDQMGTLTEYDIVVSETLDTPTVRAAIFSDMSKLAMNGFLGPEFMPILMELIPSIPKDLKDKANAMAQQSQMQQQANEEMPYQVEKYKADMAFKAKQKETKK